MNHFNSYSEDKKALLSTIWIFVLINVLFRDMHEFLQPGVLSKITSSHLNNTELLLLAGGVILALQIAMVVLSRLLSDDANRWVNLMVAVLSILLIVTTDHRGLSDVFFATAQIAGLIAIIWVALSLIRLEDLLSFIDRPTRPWS